jgi:hypothetical protein
MITWSYGKVRHVLRESDTLQEVELELPDQTTAVALHYPFLLGAVGPGEQVIVNTTAVELGLGSGGKHFISARLDTEGTPLLNKAIALCEGHIMKLRYTPLQHAVQAVEEERSEYHEIFDDTGPKTLEQMPVIVGELHSMLPIFTLALRHIQQKAGEVRGPRLCYIMSEGGALPLALSEHVRHLQSLGILTGTITYGHTFGGQTECVNIYTALLAAKFVWKADMAVVVPGPGVVGTGTCLGFSGMEQVAILEAIHKLGGIPILLPRVSFADVRERHFGISHHTRTVLDFVKNIPLIINMEEHPDLIAQMNAQSSRHTLVFHEPLPSDIWEEIMPLYPIPLTSMGRTVDTDPDFFAHMYYAARFAWARYHRQKTVQKIDLFS